MKLNSGHKIFITVGLLSSIVIIIVVLIIIPTARNIQETTQETYNLRAYMEKRYQDSLKSRLTKKKIEQIKNYSTDFNEHIFKISDTLKLVQTLENMAEQNQVKQNINDSNLDAIKPGSKITINISITGDYLNVLNYVQTIEKQDYFFNIETLRLTPSYDGNGALSKEMSANLIVTLYVNKF